VSEETAREPVEEKSLTEQSFEGDRERSPEGRRPVPLAPEVKAGIRTLMNARHGRRVIG
jgi:hypothetical protein